MGNQKNPFDYDADLYVTEQDHISEMLEYQKNQFNPGHYIGTGKTPPGVKAAGNALPVAIWMFIQAAVLVIFYCFLIRSFFSPHSTVDFAQGSPLFNFIVITLVFLAAALFSVWLGIVYLKKARRYRLQKQQLEASIPADNAMESCQIMQRICPECGKEHDIDYPKCPYCKHTYTTK